MALDRIEIENIAALAHIALTDEEVETLRDQLSNILDQFQVLSDLDIAGILPTAHPIQLQTVMRDDAPDNSLDTEDVLSNAPRREGDYFRVKPVLEE
jgi:aspartyl-tRNA(Asn)/glutamyl-tRNA(Gln) amidotransferase subunit C